MDEIDRGVWTRQEIIHANDLLDAFDEAREDADSKPPK